MPNPDKRGPWGAIIAIAVAGAVCFAVASVWKLSRVPSDLVLAVGTACLVAAFLAASVDRWFKKELVTDAFKAVFGNMLPKQLKDELAWVFEQEVLYERLDLTLRLTPTDHPDLLVARIELTRDVRNITTRKVTPQLFLAMDEWFHDGSRSRVVSLHCTQDGKTYSEMKEMPSAGLRG
jgi:hypothetical protein